MVRILVPSFAHDLHAVEVALVLRERGHEVELWNGADFPTRQAGSVELGARGLRWDVHGPALALDGRPFDIACGQLDIGNADTAMGGRMKAGVPQASGEIKPEAVFDVEHCGSAIRYMASLPLDTNVLFMTIKATKMPFEGRG